MDISDGIVVERSKLSFVMPPSHTAAPVQPISLLLTQLPVNQPGEAANVSPSMWVLDTHKGDPASC